MTTQNQGQTTFFSAQAKRHGMKKRGLSLFFA
jgi:hypothetical protein